MRDERLIIDPDFILAPKFNNSLIELLKKYPDGVPQPMACKVLGLSDKEYKEILEQAIQRLRNFIKP